MDRSLTLFAARITGLAVTVAFCVAFWSGVAQAVQGVLA